MDEESELPHREQKIKRCTSCSRISTKQPSSRKRNCPNTARNPKRNTEGNTSYSRHIEPNRANEVTDGKARK